MTTTTLTPLAAATDGRAFAGKAAQLAAALGAGLPVPNGFALAWTAVRAVVDGDRRAHLARRDHRRGSLGGPVERDR